jgi:hypothetical protein
MQYTSFREAVAGGVNSNRTITLGDSPEDLLFKAAVEADRKRLDISPGVTMATLDPQFVRGYNNYYRYSSTPAEPPKRSVYYVVYDNYGSSKQSVATKELRSRIVDFEIVTIPNHDHVFGGYSSYDQPKRFVMMQFDFGEDQIVLCMELSRVVLVYGLSITKEMEWKLGRKTNVISDWKETLDNLERYENRHRYYGFDFMFGSVGKLFYKYYPVDQKSQTNFLKAAVARGYRTNTDPNLTGIKKTYEKIRPLVDALITTDVQAYISIRSLADNSNRTIDGVKVSTIFNELFGNLTTSEEVAAVVTKFWNDGKESEEQSYCSVESSIKAMDSYKEKRKAVLKAQGNRAYVKLMQDFESLALDEVKYPLVTAAIKGGEITIATFFRKQEQYFLINDNWALWEEMLKAHHDLTVELANVVKGRSTYEKDLMSYFYFLLYGLPEYLKKMTGKKWKCIPKLVDSADELEPPKEGDDGIARKRSALTPIVDNDKLTVEVPYASLAVGGSYGTTYCYSYDYHVLSKGLSIKGNAVTEDFASKLNGKDDYGLMFYTLTGSEQGQGYPTFLIIFERRSQKGDTKVHFHRTHPCRSKGGDYNPIHRWTAVCYNWMAGNVNKNDIVAQQGDLFFVRTPKEGLVFDGKVNAYDKHTFAKEVDFAAYTKSEKSNILGYVDLPCDLMLKHTEHDDVLVPAGTYAIRQCRSWEANPQGIWSLRID